MPNSKLLLFSCLWLSTCGSFSIAQQPNIVFFLVDDQGFNDVGFNGSKDYKTPEIDKLAGQGTILSSFYVQNVCSPTRAALLTGRYPTGTGVYKIIRYGKKWILPLEERLLSEALKDAGYVTAITGKWHLGEKQPEYRPTKRGFDFQYGLMSGAIDSYDMMSAALGPQKMRDWWRNDQPSSDTGYATDLIAREAVDIINKKPADKPLFLYVPFNAVHTPHQAPDELLQPYKHLTSKRQNLGGMTAGVDKAIGEIVNALEAKGLTDNTLFIYSSDNGGVSFNSNHSNLPLRGGKGEIYEGGVRVCAFATWKGKIPAGVTVDEPMHIIDWYPTLIKLAGGNLNQPLPIHGKDIWPVFTEGAPSPHTEILLLGSDNGQRAIRMGDWKLLINPLDRHKEGANPNLSNRVELYNLKEDMTETKDLAGANPEKVKQMRRHMESFFGDVTNPDDFLLSGEKFTPVGIKRIDAGLNLQYDSNRKVYQFNQPVPWKLYNTQGKLIEKQVEKHVNLETYRQGLYFLSVLGKTVKILRD